MKEKKRILARVDAVKRAPLSMFISLCIQALRKPLGAEILDMVMGVLFLTRCKR